MPNYNSKSLGFVPKRNPRATTPRQVKPSNIGEPNTRLPPKPEARLRYDDPEMAERERLAKEETEYKKTCTAPLYNKGGYQYVFTEDQAKDVGKKNA